MSLTLDGQGLEACTVECQALEGARGVVATEEQVHHFSDLADGRAVTTTRKGTLSSRKACARTCACPSQPKRSLIHDKDCELPGDIYVIDQQMAWMEPT